MTSGTKKLRLDEILLREKLISEEQINEALMRQKMHGGKFGSQLLYHRYIDEASLVKALSIQYGCEGVILSDIEVPEQILRMIPSKLALTRMVFPFDFDSKTLTLKVASENPTNPNLINELNFVSQGKRVKLYVAAELVLETLINKHYLGRDADLNDKLLVEIPDDVTTTDARVGTSKIEKPRASALSQKSVLFVTDEEYASSLLESILSRDGYEVSIVESFEAASALVARGNISAVFIKENIDGNRALFIETIRKASPRTIVQVFKSASSLILHDEAFSIAEGILTRNLNLFTSLLSSKDNQSHNHSATVGQYSDKLCRKLGLSSRDRMMVVQAAYLHDIARYYFADPSADYKAIVGSTRKLLSSFEYSDAIINMLSAMYKDLKGGDKVSASLDVLGGNIITIVDLFCENIVFDREFTLEKFEAVKKRLRDFAGKLFYAEVVEGFIGMIQEEILSLQTNSITGRVLLFANDVKTSYPLLLRLKNEGFQILTIGTVQNLLESKDNADALIIRLEGDIEVVTRLLNDAIETGFDFENMPAILVVESGLLPKLAWLYERGVEDILAEDSNLELLILKLRKLLSKSARESALGQMASQATGARGRLADMNLIDLMQALAPGRKSVKITVLRPQAPTEPLLIYLDKGILVFAQLGVRSGADAIYEGMTWTEGSWTVDPVAPENLPTPNNSLSNDAVLMEGAYRLDEKMRAGKL